MGAEKERDEINLKDTTESKAALLRQFGENQSEETVRQGQGFICRGQASTSAAEASRTDPKRGVHQDV